MNSMPIDLAAVDWFYVVILAVFVFFATLIGSVLAFNHRFFGALLSAILFTAAFVFWTYYPHHLPLPTTLTLQKAAAPPRRRLRPRPPPRYGRATPSPILRRRLPSQWRPPRRQRRRPRRPRTRLATDRLIDVLSRSSRFMIVRESGGVA